ncbi:MAG: hypothetical protein ACT6XY_02165 [Phreatobacter sp.]|jgi:hypothetical protein|uniref:hypothetical protein n=1 Tax=Phreatobacter sp. TaxID=1966341 RepID=UPI0040370DA5
MQTFTRPTPDPTRRSDKADPMVASLGRRGELTDAEAFAVLRKRFPETALCERVAAIADWRRG